MVNLLYLKIIKLDIYQKKEVYILKKKVIEQIVYLATLRGISKKEAKENTLKWLKRLGIEEYENRKLDTLSKGNQQKVQLAQTLVCNPEIIVILDEPFSGLDPVNAQILKDVVKS